MYSLTQLDIIYLIAVAVRPICRSAVTAAWATVALGFATASLLEYGVVSRWGLSDVSVVVSIRMVSAGT